MTKRLFRLIAVLVLSVILLPFIFTFYFSVSPGCTPQELGNSIVETVPLGEQILKTFTALTSDGGISGFESAVDWLEYIGLPVGEVLLLEVSQLFLISVIMLALEAILKKILKDVEKGLLNQIANIVYKCLVVFSASLFANFVYDFFLEQVSMMTGTSQDIMIYVVSAISIVGGIVALIVGKGFFKSIFKCLLKVSELVVTYALCMALFLAIFPWYPVIFSWVVIIWVFYFLEKLVK